MTSNDRSHLNLLPSLLRIRRSPPDLLQPHAHHSPDRAALHGRVTVGGRTDRLGPAPGGGTRPAAAPTVLG